MIIFYFTDSIEHLKAARLAIKVSSNGLKDDVIEIVHFIRLTQSFTDKFYITIKVSQSEKSVKFIGFIPFFDKVIVKSC